MSAKRRMPEMKKRLRICDKWPSMPIRPELFATIPSIIDTGYEHTICPPQTDENNG
jgi:hypothetical protein